MKISISILIVMLCAIAYASDSKSLQIGVSIRCVEQVWCSVDASGNSTTTYWCPTREHREKVN